MANREIVLGASKVGQPVTMSISASPRIGILSASGGGKSTITLSICAQMAKALRHKVQFVAIDPKLSSLLPMQNRVAVPIVCEPQDYLPTLQRVEELLMSRLATMRKRGVSKLDPEIDGDEFPMCILISEELLSITNNSDLSKKQVEAIRAFYLTYLTRARSANMGAIIISHTFESSLTFSTAARSQLQQRIILKSGINESKLFLEGADDVCMPHLINEPGVGYYSDGDYARWIQFKGFYLNDERARELFDSYAADKRDVGLGWAMGVESPFET